MRRRRLAHQHRQEIVDVASWVSKRRAGGPPAISGLERVMNCIAVGIKISGMTGRQERERKMNAGGGGIIGILCLVMLVVLPSPAVTECKTDLNDSFESELITLINGQRESNGLKPLAPHSQLKAAAHGHSADMACNELSSHASSDGSSTGDRVIAQGYRFLAMGENIAAGYDTPEEVVAEWMRSAKHRKNILDPSFTDIGAGYIYRSNSRYCSYWTAIFGCRIKSDWPRE